MMLTKKEWASVKPSRTLNITRGYKLRLKNKVWTNVFNNVFSRYSKHEMKGCELKFHYHKINPDIDLKLSKANYSFSSKASCNREGCKMEYMLRILRKPVKDAYVDVEYVFRVDILVPYIPRISILYYNCLGQKVNFIMTQHK